MRTTLFLSTFTLVLALATLSWAQRPAAPPPSEMTRARYCHAVGQLAARVETALTREKLTPSQVLLREGAQAVPPDVLAFIQADTAHRPLRDPTIPPSEPWQKLVRGIVYRVSRRPANVNVQNALEAFCLQHPDTLLAGGYYEKYDIW